LAKWLHGARTLAAVRVDIDAWRFEIAEHGQDWVRN
jgi:hypothetical protein